MSQSPQDEYPASREQLAQLYEAAQPIIVREAVALCGIMQAISTARPSLIKSIVTTDKNP